jgi:small subunit ribosomal protein S6
VREFDTTAIVQPEISEEAREAFIERMKGLLERSGAVPLEVDDMGKRKLAYEIRRFQKGHYLSFFYLDQGKAVAELERALRLDESILRFLTVRRADHVSDVEARKVRAVELEKVRHEKAAERAAREAEERSAREAARLAGEPVEEGEGGDEDEEFGRPEAAVEDDEDDERPSGRE